MKTVGEKNGLIVINERCEGASRTTLKTPSDFPQAYNYGRGRFSLFGYETIEKSSQNQRVIRQS